MITARCLIASRVNPPAPREGLQGMREIKGVIQTESERLTGEGQSSTPSSTTGAAGANAAWRRKGGGRKQPP
jgi:hypothetical protein